MQTSLILYAEHEFNASTFTARVIAGTGSDIYSCIAGAIGALKGPKHGGANEVALEIQKRYQRPDEAETDMRWRVANAKSLLASATRCIPSAIRAATSSRRWLADWQKPVEICGYSMWLSALNRPCTRSSACFPILTGTARWHTT